MCYHRKMVVQRTIENLRARSREDRKAIASSVAFLAAALIFVIWAFFFAREFSVEPLSDSAKEAYTAAAGAVGQIEVNGIVLPE